MAMVSPSQVNTYFACPRKWYYAYVKKIPVEEKFALVRGKLVHRVCEDFFSWRPPGAMSYSELKDTMVRNAMELLDRHWEDMEISERFGNDRYEETRRMVEHFVHLHGWRMESIYSRYRDVLKAWHFSKPRFTEYYIEDQELNLHGYIDAVHEIDGRAVIVDYKTSSVYQLPISEEHQWQLYMYALLYTRKEHSMPSHVCAQYLLTGQTSVYPVRTAFLQEAERLVRHVVENTQSRDEEDYPRNTGYKFCRYCEYRHVCFED